MPHYGSLDSKEGWVVTPLKLADNLLTDFYTSNASQTILLPAPVYSMAWYIQEYQVDWGNCLSQIQTALQNYFSAYFSNVTVSVTDNSDEASAINSFELYATFCDKAEYAALASSARVYNLREVVANTSGRYARVLSTLKG